MAEGWMALTRWIFFLVFPSGFCIWWRIWLKQNNYTRREQVSTATEIIAKWVLTDWGLDKAADILQMMFAELWKDTYDIFWLNFKNVCSRGSSRHKGNCCLGNLLLVNSYIFVRTVFHVAPFYAPISEYVTYRQINGSFSCHYWWVGTMVRFSTSDLMHHV